MTIGYEGHLRRVFCILTDDEHSQAVAQASQVRHQVHQDQKLRPGEERQPVSRRHFHLNKHQKEQKLLIRVSGFPLSSHWTQGGLDMGHPRHIRKGMCECPRTSPRVSCHILARSGLTLGGLWA